MPSLQKNRAADQDNPIFAQHDKLRCCRTPEWKFILNRLADQPDELYNLQRDPAEHDNLIQSRDVPGVSDVYRTLKSDLLGWMKEIEDPLLAS